MAEVIALKAHQKNKRLRAENPQLFDLVTKIHDLEKELEEVRNTLWKTIKLMQTLTPSKSLSQPAEDYHPHPSESSSPGILVNE